MRFDGDFHQITNDRFDITPDIADFSELGRLDLDKRRIGQPCQTTGDFGLADTGRPDHQNIFRGDFLAQRLGHLRPPPTVA